MQQATSNLLSLSFHLGANASAQAISFALCFAIGLAGGVAALLYLRKARPFERALTDFVATLIIGALFVISIEFVLNGKFELYGAAAFVLGTLLIPLIAKKTLDKIARKKKNTADNTPERKKDAE